MSQVNLPNQIASGDADNPTRDMANWTTIRDIINGNLDNTNLSASAAIAISKTTLGTFTAWAAYTPTTATDGTWGTVTVNFARWCQIGKVVYVDVNITGTTSGTVTHLDFSLPVTPTNTTSRYVTSGFGCIETGDILRAGTAAWDSASSKMLVRRESANTWTNAAGIGVAGQLFYEVT